jgi:hypothetical protein
MVPPLQKPCEKVGDEITYWEQQKWVCSIWPGDGNDGIRMLIALRNLRCWKWPPPSAMIYRS